MPIGHLANNAGHLKKILPVLVDIRARAIVAIQLKWFICRHNSNLSQIFSLGTLDLDLPVADPVFRG